MENAANRPQSPYLLVTEAAAYLRTTVQGVYSLVKRRKLQPMPGRPGRLLRGRGPWPAERPFDELQQVARKAGPANRRLRGTFTARTNSPRRRVCSVRGETTWRCTRSAPGIAGTPGTAVRPGTAASDMSTDSKRCAVADQRSDPAQLRHRSS